MLQGATNSGSTEGNGSFAVDFSGALPGFQMHLLHYVQTDSLKDSS